MRKCFFQLILCFAVVSAASQEKIATTNLNIQQTTGIAGTVLDIFVPLRLNLLGVLINKDETWFLGVFSKDSKKIEVYKYNGNQ